MRYAYVIWHFIYQISLLRFIKTNKKLDELIKHRNITNYVKVQRLSWSGHINRMPETSIVKRIYNWKPFTGRPAGRPKSRWEDNVRNDRKKMKLMKWKNKYRTALNGRILWRRPRLYQSCSAIEEEEVVEEEEVWYDLQGMCYIMRLSASSAWPALRDVTYSCGFLLPVPCDLFHGTLSMQLFL